MDSNRSPEKVYLNLLISGVYMDFNRSPCVLHMDPWKIDNKINTNPGALHMHSM